jgi:hypothetical protein
VTTSGVRPLGTCLAYDLAGLSIEVRCDDPMVGGLIDGRFLPLRATTHRTGPADIVIEVRGPGADPGWLDCPDGALRAIYDAPEGSIGYAEASDELYVFYGRRVIFRCRPAAGRIDMAIVSDGLADALFATQLLLTIGIFETFKRFGQFPLHAGALARRGRGILLPGTSGAGKSTTTVALVRAGFDFLGDDTVFLSSTSEPVSSGSESTDIVATGFPDQVDVTEHTISMVLELHHLLEEPLLPGRYKHSLRVEDVFASRIVVSCRPALVVFLQVVSGRQSRAEPIDSSGALRGLLPNVLLTEPTSSQAHLDMLGRLARTVPAFTLLAGSDLDGVASCLSGLLEDVAP